VEAVRDAASEHERPRPQPLAVIRLDLDRPVAPADVIHPAARADHATRLQDARGERPIEAGPVEDGDLFARILELRDSTARRDHETGRWPAEHDVVRDLVQAVRLPPDDAGAVRGGAELLVLFEEEDVPALFRGAGRRIEPRRPRTGHEGNVHAP